MMKERVKIISNGNALIAQPCSLCGAPMHCHNTAVLSGDQNQHFFLVACSDCGYGPATAFSTTTEAVMHWNQYASTRAEAKQKEHNNDCRR